LPPMGIAPAGFCNQIATSRRNDAARCSARPTRGRRPPSAIREALLGPTGFRDAQPSPTTPQEVELTLGLFPRLRLPDLHLRRLRPWFRMVRCRVLSKAHPVQGHLSNTNPDHAFDRPCHRTLRPLLGSLNLLMRLDIYGQKHAGAPLLRHTVNNQVRRKAGACRSER
jgi:hypothetical protein